MAESCVKTWLSELDVETSPSYKTNFRKFLLWLWKKPEWAGKMPSELLDFQENAVGRERMRLPKLGHMMLGRSSFFGLSEEPFE